VSQTLCSDPRLFRTRRICSGITTAAYLWQRLLPTRLREFVKGKDEAVEAVGREFLESDEGEPYGPVQQPVPHFSAQILQMREARSAAAEAAEPGSMARFWHREGFYPLERDAERSRALAEWSD